MANIYSVTEKINGKEYTAQFNGISAAEDAIDLCGVDDPTSNAISNEKLADYLFENVIMSPNVRIEDFGAEKIGKKEEKTIGGVKYVAEFKGLRTALRVQDNSYKEGTTKLSQKKYAKNLFDKVIVSPENLTSDDFECMDDYNAVIAFARDVMQGGEVLEEFNEIITFARKVMQGDFRNKVNGKSAKDESKS